MFVWIGLGGLAIVLVMILVATWALREGASSKRGSSSTTVVLHYTDWCGACKRMKPVWYRAKTLSRARFHEVNEEKTPTPGVTSYPTIYRYVDGHRTKYEGGADVDELLMWIERV